MNRFSLRWLLALILPLALIYIVVFGGGFWSSFSGITISEQAMPEWRKEDWSIASEIASVHNEKGGSSFNPSFGGNLIGQPAIALSAFPERTVFLDKASITREDLIKYMDANADLLRRSFLGMGTWLNTKTKKTELDIIVTLPARNQEQRMRATVLGRSLNRVALYDLALQKEIDLGGNGKALPDLPPVEERIEMIKSILMRKE